MTQIMPKFVTARALYEVRERPSRAYSWIAFLVSTIVVEIPYQIVVGIVVFLVWNYTVLGIESSSRQGLILLYFMQFFVWASTFAHMVIAALPDSETAAQLAIVMFILSLLFSGVIQPIASLPQFWHFLWRVSPLTYWVSGIVATGDSGKIVTCETAELSVFDPPPGSTCAAYLAPYFNTMHAPGYLMNPNATKVCEYCALSFADQFLAMRDIYWEYRWRNWGLGMVYIGFNVGMTVVLYWFFRLGRWRRIVAIFRKGGMGKQVTV
jgi:ATP-binding cassette, subfamily G (WHITE), member 2, PDR